jgi:hypothetical protein
MPRKSVASGRIRTSGLAEHRRQRRGHHRRIDAADREAPFRIDREGAPTGSAVDPAVMGAATSLLCAQNDPSLARHPKPCPRFGVALLASPTKHARLEPDHFEYLMVWFESTPP